MDYSACNVVYVDRTAKQDRLIRRKESVSSTTDEHFAGADGPSLPESQQPTTADLNVQTLLETFSEGTNFSYIHQIQH